jgi:hypothetical protein
MASGRNGVVTPEWGFVLDLRPEPAERFDLDHIAQKCVTKQMACLNMSSIGQHGIKCAGALVAHAA